MYKVHNFLREKVKMLIGELAAQAEVNIQTVRLYERLGLLKKPRRLTSGYRDYSIDAVQLLRFIKRTQKLGFTLNEIKTLVELRAQGNYSATSMSEIARTKLTEIDEKILHLQSMRNAIEHGMQQCRCSSPYPLCLLVEIGDSKALPVE
jgi:DNA-binding transcriptional MerR regulator